MGGTIARSACRSRHQHLTAIAACAAIAILSTDSVGKAGDGAVRFPCAARLCEVAHDSDDFVGDGRAVGLRPEPLRVSAYRPPSLSQRLLQHSCASAPVPTPRPGASARPTVQGMPAVQARRTGMRPADRAGNTAGLRAPPLARFTAGLLGPGGRARPPGLISQLWSRRTFSPAKRWQVSRQCRA